MFIIFGYIGFTLAVLSYFLLTNGKIAAHSKIFLILNSLSCVGILIGLISAWNLGVFIINICWLGISIKSYIKHHYG